MRTSRAPYCRIALGFLLGQLILTSCLPMMRFVPRSPAFDITVTNNGRPVENAKVTVECSDAWLNLASGRSDEMGKIVFKPKTKFQWIMWYPDRECWQSYVEISDKSGERFRISFDVYLLPFVEDEDLPFRIVCDLSKRPTYEAPWGPPAPGVNRGAILRWKSEEQIQGQSRRYCVDKGDPCGPVHVTYDGPSGTAHFVCGY